MTRSRAIPALALAGALLLAGGPIGLGVPDGPGGLANAAPPVSVVSRGPRTAGRVALTFDDGASPANCRRILATLVARGVPATFFPVADAMRADPAFWRMVVAVGDPIGDHTLTHPQMPALSASAQFQQIDGARRLAETISGAPLLRAFRPPYGAYDATTLRQALRAGFATVLLWDTSDRDTSPHGSVAEMLAAAERATAGSVILMHCGPNATPFLLGPLLDHLAGAGLRPVTVPQLLGIGWTGRPAASPPTPAQILDGLSPLPPAPSGGVVIGPAGIGTMTFPPAPPTSEAAPSATAEPSPGQPTTAPASASPPASPPAAGSPAPTASPTSLAQDQSAASGPGAALALALLSALLAAAILALGLSRARRR